MKVYPINEDALERLSDYSRDANWLFAAGGAFIGFSLDLGKDLIITGDIPAFRFGLAAATSVILFAAGLICVIAALGKMKSRGTALAKIKTTTTFIE